MFDISFLFFLALNSGLGALMGLGVVISSVVYTFVDSVWYLDSIVGLLIALVLFSTGVRFVVYSNAF